MGGYTARRLLAAVPTFFGITLVTFALIHLVPGDPSAMQGDLARPAQLSREALESQRRALGLDRPLPAQYAAWLGRVLILDFGLSSRDGRPVIDKIEETLPRTALLSGLALLLSYLAAIPLGAYAAVRRGSLGERVSSALLLGLYSLPSFWVAVLLGLFLAGGRYLSLFPLQGLHSEPAPAGVFAAFGDLCRHLALPVLCLSYAPLASLSRYMRSGMLEALGQDFVRAARAKGLPERAVLLRHALPHALVPLVALLGLQIPALIGGSVVVERIFGIPGMGMLAFEAVLGRDYATAMGVTTLAALLTLLGGLVGDLAGARLDPRIKLG